MVIEKIELDVNEYADVLEAERFVNDLSRPLMVFRFAIGRIQSSDPAQRKAGKTSLVKSAREIMEIADRYTECC